MRLTFRLHFNTQWKQRLFISGNIPSLGAGNPDLAIPLHHLGHGQWELSLELPAEEASLFSYTYFLLFEDQDQREWEGGTPRLVKLDGDRERVVLQDQWLSRWEEEIAWFSSAFTQVLMRPKASRPRKSADANKGSPVHFRIRAPRVPRHLKLCLLGDHPKLGSWEKPIMLNNQDYPTWKVAVSLEFPRGPIAYKYGLYDPKKRKVVAWEAGENRWLRSPEAEGQLSLQHDESFRYANGPWRGAGVAVPVFSLRSNKGMGVGEFMDLKQLVDWALQVGLKLIQILPINDTVATHTWQDSYPYGAISVFALHPIYANLESMGRLKAANLRAEFERHRLTLNDRKDIDYEAVMLAKSRYFKLLYDQERDSFLADPAFLAFFKSNRDWLQPYAAFCYLRDRYLSPNFNEWPDFSTYDTEKVASLCDPQQAHYDDIAIHYFIQYHLHRQLSEVASYARQEGVVLKGDIPIGIYRYSVDAWTQPELYNMDGQSGAPPDDFAVAGQNWGFPTYNWDLMAENGFAWWRKRLTQMAAYFDAFRIDHILGFFRIWEIPYAHTQGIMGQFNPSLPFSREELAQQGIWLDRDRYCRPYIRAHLLTHFFGEHHERVQEEFLEATEAGHFYPKPALATQRALVDYIARQIAKTPDLQAYYEAVEPGLLSLWSHVLFFPVETPHGERYNPRIAFQHTPSFQELDPHTQQALNRLYDAYFYHRHEGYWREQAMVKLPALKQATDMLICGEDLGMVPDSVPGVMKELGILSLEIQRMPKDPKRRFGHPADAPYLSVVSTSTHDMAPIRLWWEADHSLSERFFREILAHGSSAPYFCEDWVAQDIIRQHFYSPGMWAIIPIQDLLAMDADLRRPDPREEQINVPANPKHYWRYRLHLDLDTLQSAEEFNQLLYQLLIASGRTGSY